MTIKFLVVNRGTVENSRGFVGWICSIFKKGFTYLFLERGEEKERERGEKHQCVVTSCTPPTGDLACNPGMCQ